MVAGDAAPVPHREIMLTYKSIAEGSPRFISAGLSRRRVPSGHGTADRVQSGSVQRVLATCQVQEHSAVRRAC